MLDGVELETRVREQDGGSSRYPEGGGRKRRGREERGRKRRDRVSVMLRLQFLRYQLSVEERFTQVELGDTAKNMIMICFPILIITIYNL